MFWTKNGTQQNLSTKIAVAFTLVALTLLGNMTYTLIKIFYTRGVNLTLYQDTAPKISTALRLMKGVQSLRMNERDWLISQNPSYQAAREANWKTIVYPSIQTLQKMHSSKKDLDTIKQLSLQITALYASIQKADAQLNLPPSTQQDFFYHDIYPTGMVVQNILETYIKDKQDLLFSELLDVRHQVRSILLVDGILLIIGLILCILLGIVLSNMTNALRKNQQTLEERTQELEQEKLNIENANRSLALTKKQLEEKAHALSLASEYKSQFLTNMSHELRTPLNSLLILAKIFADNSEKNLNEEQVQSANIMLKSGRELLSLINDILDLAKVESGKLEVHFSKFNIRKAIDNLYSLFSYVAKEKKIDFFIAVDDDVPEMITSDEKRVSQVIRNLISNALKFTEEGYVKLHVYLSTKITTQHNLTNPSKNYLPQQFPVKQVAYGKIGDLMHKDVGAKGTWFSQGGNFTVGNLFHRGLLYLAISIEDTGIGILPEKQRLIFESFQQADGTTSRKYGGTGLGLSISREFSKLLDGFIQLNSSYGKGSTFTLYLPLTIPEKKDIDTLPEKESASSVVKEVTLKNIAAEKKPYLKKLLMIEDDLNFANTLMILCRKKGYLCKHASSAKEALEILNKDLPDAIFLDMNLPDANDSEFLEKLGINKETANIPLQLIGLSEKKIPFIKNSTIEYLSEPITERKISEALDNIEKKQLENIKNIHKDSYE